METSAKASINVEEAFLTLASDIKAKMEKRMVCNSIQYDSIQYFFIVIGNFALIIRQSFCILGSE